MTKVYAELLGHGLSRFGRRDNLMIGHELLVHITLSIFRSLTCHLLIYSLSNNVMFLNDFNLV
jgi:hypothetical protein